MVEARRRIEAWFRLRARRRNLGASATLRTVLDSAGAGLALLDAEDALVAWNPDFAAIAGPSLPLRPGLKLISLVAPDARETLTTLLTAGHRLTVPLASPEAIRVEMERRPVRAPETGAVLRLTRPVEAPPEEEGQAAAARLRAVGALAGGIAHDFNNLLTAIAGSAEAALARAPGNDAAAELQQVLESAGRGAALVKQLLAFARQQALRPRVVELNAAVNGMAELLKRLLGSRVRLSVEIEEPGRRVKIDPTQLDQVIMNLALNARDAMAEGGTLTIRTGHAVVLRPEPIGTELLPPGRWAMLEVADSGAGIPAEVVPRIFEPFFTTRRDQGGTGLGLSTVHGIVRQSGGFIAVESKRGEGTTFRIWLPRHDGPADPELPASLLAPPRAPVAERRAAPAEAAGSGEAGPLVLLVEDEVPLLRLAERALRRAGFNVLSAGSAEEALELMAAEGPRPVALVSDVVMPGMDGLELATRLRAADPDLPVLLVSGYAEAALGRDLAAERLRLLPKPYSLSDLVAELQAILPGLPAKVS
jgi:two-component system cell cycle sensor histidine kinase/response regulator CckA